MSCHIPFLSPNHFGPCLNFFYTFSLSFSFFLNRRKHKHTHKQRHTHINTFSYTLASIYKNIKLTHIPDMAKVQPAAGHMRHTNLFFGPWTFFVTLKSKQFYSIKTIMDKKCTYFFSISIKKIKYFSASQN